MEIPIDQVLSQLLVMALSAIAGWLGGKLKGAAAERKKAEEEKHEERDSMRGMLRMLLYYRIKDLFEEYVVRGEPITGADKHEIEEIYDYYQSLNGNGEGRRMYKELMELKTE